MQGHDKDERHNKDLVVRLRRAEGQLRGIQAMIEEGADCERLAQAAALLATFS